MEEFVEEEIEEIEEDYEFVKPIEIEEGMPDDVKEAITRFNKRVSGFLNVVNGSSLDDQVMELDDDEDDDEVDDQEADNDEDVMDDDSSEIIEDDDSDSMGDLF